MLKKDKLKQEVDKGKWYHRLDFGNGIVTPGVVDCSTKLKDIGMPQNLHGMTVTDIGAWDGFSHLKQSGEEPNVCSL